MAGAAARDGSTVLRVEHLTMRFGGLVAIAAIVMIGGTEIMRELDFLKQIFGETFDPTQYRMLLFGFAMVAIMIWRPRGLISTREPSVFLKRRKTIAADLVKQGRG